MKYILITDANNKVMIFEENLTKKIEESIIR